MKKGHIGIVDKAKEQARILACITEPLLCYMLECVWIVQKAQETSSDTGMHTTVHLCHYCTL